MITVDLRHFRHLSKILSNWVDKPLTRKWISDTQGCLYKHTRKPAMSPGNQEKDQPALLWCSHLLGSS